MRGQVTELNENLEGLSSDPKVQAALTFATTIVEAHGQVTDTDIQSVREAGYSDEQIIEILGHVALNILTNYFNEAFKTSIDFPAVSTGLSVHSA